MLLYLFPLDDTKAPVGGFLSLIRTISLDTSDQGPEVTAFNPFLAIRSTPLAPSLTDLTHDLRRSSSYNRAWWDDHVRRDDRIR